MVDILVKVSECQDPSLAAILNVVKNILLLIQIIGPILLIVMGVIHLIRLMKNPDDKKAFQSLKNSLIAAFIIFMIPVIVNAFMYLLDDTFAVSECWNQVGPVDYDVTFINPDGNSSRKGIITNPDDYEKGTPKPSPSTLNSDAGGGVIDGSCYAEYVNGTGFGKITVDTSKVSGNHYKFINEGRVVQEGTSTSYQSSNIFELLIHPSIEVELSDGKTKKAECEVKHSTNLLPYYQDGYYFSKGAKSDRNHKVSNPYPGAGISYYIYVPKDFNANTKYPVVLALHGGYGYGVPCKGSTTPEAYQTYHFLKSALYKNRYPINHVNNPDVNAIVIAPSNMTCGWEGSIYRALDILHTYIKLYNIDVDRIVVTGTSQGGYGTLYGGFLEEHIIYKSTDNNTSLESVAQMYHTTADEVKKYNKSLKINISYSDKAGTKLKIGSYTIIKPKSTEGMRGLFSVLVPMSPAKNASRCIFTPSTVYDKSNSCSANPVYTLKTPIWVISSNDEYNNIQQFAKELTAYYEKNGDIRYTVLSSLEKDYKTDSHNTQIPMLGYTNTFDWMIAQKYGNVTTRNNSEIDAIEKQLGQVFVKDFHP